MKKQDVALFLFSFAVAVVMWLVVGEKTRNKVYNVPLTIDTREGYAAIYPPAIVSVNVTGSQVSMDKLREQDLRAVVNLTSSGEGTVDAPVMVSGPKDLDLTYAPQKPLIRISLEKEDRKTFTIELKRPGPDGQSVSTIPPKVIVRGPHSLVDQIVRAAVGYDLAKEPSEQESKWKVELLDKNGKAMTDLVVEPDVVEVDTNLLSLGPRSLVVAPSLFGQPAPGFKFGGSLVKPSVVKAQVPPNLAANLASLSTAPVHIDNAKADVTVKVAVLPPDGVRLTGVSEVEVTVKIVPDTSAPPVTPTAPGKKG